MLVCVCETVTMMTRVLSTVCLTLAMVTSVFVAVGTLTSRVDIVPVLVSVTDENGNGVGGLTAKNFQIRDESQLKRVVLLKGDGDFAMSIGVAMDYSLSMRSKAVAAIAAVNTFSGTRRFDDQMFIASFNDAVTLWPSAGFGSSRQMASYTTALAGSRPSGARALSDGLFAALDRLDGSAVSAPRALIVVTDGGKDASRHRLSELPARARQSQALIYTMAIRANDDGDQSRATLEQVARDSGGVSYTLTAANQIGGAMTNVARHLRQLYMLGFEPTREATAGRRRSFEVIVSVPGRDQLRVRARTSYLPPQTPRPR